MDNQEHCVCCGNPIPEGYMTCYKCRKNSIIHNPDFTMSCEKPTPLGVGWIALYLKNNSK